MTFAHHNTPFGNQRRGGKTKFVRAQQCANDNITTGFYLPIHLQSNAPAQVVQNQSLVCFRQAKFPRRSGAFDG